MMLKIISGIGFLAGVRFLNTVAILQQQQWENSSIIEDHHFPSFCVAFDNSLGVHNNGCWQPKTFASNELALCFSIHSCGDTLRHWSLLNPQWYPVDQPILMVCSSSAKQRKLFSHLPNAEYLKPTEQEIVDQLICSLIKSDQLSQSQKNIITQLEYHLSSKYQHLLPVLGCSELHGIKISNSHDPLKLIAQSIVKPFKI